MNVGPMALQQKVFEFLTVELRHVAFHMGFNKDVFVNHLFNNLLLSIVDSLGFNADVEEVNHLINSERWIERAKTFFNVHPVNQFISAIALREGMEGPEGVETVGKV